MVAEGKQLNDAGITSVMLAAEAGQKIVRQTLVGMGATTIGGVMANPIIAVGGVATAAVLNIKTMTDVSSDIASLNAYENHVNGKSAVRVRGI